MKYQSSARPHSAVSSSIAEAIKGRRAANWTALLWSQAVLLFLVWGSIGCIGGPTLDPGGQQILACKAIAGTGGVGPPTGIVLSPNQAPAGTQGLTITVTDPTLASNGDGFAKIATVLWNGSANGISQTRADAFTIQAHIPASLLATSGTAMVSVGQDCVSSSQLDFFSDNATFTITAVSALPTISSLAPSSASVGGPAFLLRVLGTNFVQSSMVQWNGANRSTHFVSTTEVDADILASDLTASGTASIVVVNPTGASNTVQFTIQAVNPVPAISSLAPNNAQAGAAALLLKVLGRNFVQTSIVQWNGSNRTTHFVGTTEVDADIPASDLAAAGAASVNVVNPAPGGGTSDTAQFTISPVSAAPTISALVPNIVQVGAAAFLLKVQGANFVQGSTVQWNGSVRTTHFVSATEVDADIMAPDLSAVGTAPIVVVNPASGTSNTLLFKINYKPGVFGLVSMATDNIHSGNSSSDAPASNVDGRFIAFSSVSGNLTTDSLSTGQVFLRDTCLGTASCTPHTTLVSQADPSFVGPPNNFSDFGSISANGRFVAFASDATNLVPGGTTIGIRNIFLFDTTKSLQAGHTQLISVNTAGSAANADNGHLGISANGRFVAFRSLATNLDPASLPNVLNIFVRDTCFEAPAGCSPSTKLISLSSSGQAANHDNEFPSVSADGRFVAFESLATNLDPAATDGRTHVYLRDTCAGSAPAGCTPSTILVSTGFTDGAAQHESSSASVSANGRFVAFASVPFSQPQSFHQVFVRDTCAGVGSGCTPSTTQVSLQFNNAAPDGDSESPTISADARYVAYASRATQQVAGDNNGFLDDFVRDTCIGADPSCLPQTARASVKTDGTQTNLDDQFGSLVAVAGNGQAVAFASSASNLVANDNNNAGDVFLSTTGLSEPAFIPAITVFSPASVSHAIGQLVLTVTGTGFVPGAQVQWNGAPRDTTYINSSTLEVFLPASDAGTAGSAQVTVANPFAGANSAAVVFTIN
jgi:hypothetical protein